MSQHRVWYSLLITTLWLMTPPVSTVSFAEAVASPTVLITGSNRGIGLGLTRVYAEAGWRVLATCRNPDAANDLAALAKQYPFQKVLHYIA